MWEVLRYLFCYSLNGIITSVVITSTFILIEFLNSFLKISISTIGFIYMLLFFWILEVIMIVLTTTVNIGCKFSTIISKEVIELIWYIFRINKKISVIILKFILCRLFFPSTKNTIYRVPCLFILFLLLSNLLSISFLLYELTCLIYFCTFWISEDLFCLESEYIVYITCSCY